ncbi:MAG: formate dehydrogenase subunit alpha [Dehalococcoidia bacterium]
MTTAPEATRTLALTIDGARVEVPAGATVLDAILAGGSHVPHLCKDDDQEPLGACRTCLVEVEGVRGFPASCYLAATDGMAVRTRGEALDRVRTNVLDLTLGMVEPGGRGASALAGEAERYGVGGRFAARAERHLDDSTPAFSLNLADCILCGRCVQGCQDVQHIGAIAVLGGGEAAHIGTHLDEPLVDSICTSCGTCVSVCPTQALSPKPEPAPVAQEVSTTCGYCGVGCGVGLQIDADGRLGWVEDRPDNPSSQGMLCVKGRFGLTFVQHEDRLTTPLIRRNGVLEEATWDEALDLVADKLVEHRGSFAALASAKATNEDAYVLQKFVRGLMGTNSIDHCTRLCHSPSVEAMLMQLGSGATSNSYEDYDNAGCLMVVGSDTSSNHPVIASRLRRAIDERGAQLIVVNPKRIELCDYATYFLQPQPGTDVALFNGLAKVVLDEALVDEAFVRDRTRDFEAFAASLEEYTPERVEEITGVPADDIRGAARLYARPPFSGSCVLWGMGVTQHTCGTDNAHALVNLALMTGQMGKPGSGVSPLRGQNNVQGCGDAGCIPDNLPGYQGLGDTNRAKFEAGWGVELPSEQGLRATEMFELAAEGGLRAMYVTGENPLLSEPYIAHAEEAIERLDFLVVQDIFPNETTAHADVVLPATSFAEKDGTFTNSERRVQRVRKAIAPVGQSRPDWEITADLARRVAKRLELSQSQFAWTDASEVFDEMASLTPILGGISYGRLEGAGIQWPCPTPDHPGTPRLYGETFSVGRAPFVAVEQGPPAAELPNRRFPLILNTGRVLYHWHGGTITTRARVLNERMPELPVAIHPRDAAKADIEDGGDVEVLSRRGQLTGKAVVTDAVQPGSIFVPFARLGEFSANYLTNAVYDPKSRIPEYKVCAVRIAKPGAPDTWRRGRGSGRGGRRGG